MDPVPGVAGLLLTGGASRRMGRDKATVTIDGVPLGERAAGALTAACEPCIEVGPGFTGLLAVQEVPPGSGPLAAVVAGRHALRVETGHDGPVVVLACDMPGVTPDLLRLLAGVETDESVIPEADGELQPLCARYAPDALARADELVAAGERSMQALVRTIRHRRLAETTWSAVAGPHALDDVDTPDDLERLQ